MADESGFERDAHIPRVVSHLALWSVGGVQAGSRSAKSMKPKWKMVEVAYAMVARGEGGNSQVALRMRVADRHTSSYSFNRGSGYRSSLHRACRCAPVESCPRYPLARVDS